MSLLKILRFQPTRLPKLYYGDEAPKRKAESSGNAMRPQKRLHFKAPSAIETLYMDILLLLTDYMGTRDMIHLQRTHEVAT